MEIPLVVGRNKCVIVSSSPYTHVNHMPEMLWARPHWKWHGCEPGEATTPRPALGLGRASHGRWLHPHHPPPMPPHGPLCISPHPHPTPASIIAVSEWRLGDWGCCMIQEKAKNTQGSPSVLSPHGPFKLVWIITSHGSQPLCPSCSGGHPAQQRHATNNRQGHCSTFFIIEFLHSLCPGLG